MLNMEVILSAIGLGIGVVSALLSYLVPLLSAPPPRAGERPRITAGLALSAAVIVVFSALALVRVPPFSPGQHLGMGYLISGLAALASAFACCRLVNPGQGYWPYPFALAMSLALAAASLGLLIFRGDPVDGLLGCALGFTVVAGIFRITYATGRMLDLFRALEAGAAFAVTLSAACAFAVHQFDRRDMRGWWAFPLALAGFWLLGHTISFFCSLLRSLAKRPALAAVISAALSAIFVCISGGLLALELEPSHSLLLVLATGAVAGALIAWLTFAAEREGGDWTLWLQVSGVVALLAMFLLVVSFKLFVGLGIAVGLIAAWAILGSVLGMGAFAARLSLQALVMGANFVLLQLLLRRVGLSFGEVEMSLHYTIIGTMLGVLLPAVYSALLLEAGLGRALLLGLLCFTTPVILIALWGADALVGFVVGLVARQGLATSFAALATVNEKWAPWQAPTALLGMGMAIVSTQAGRSLAFLYQVPRIDKAYLAGAIALVVALWAIGRSLHGLAKRRRGEATGSLSGGWRSEP